MKKILNPKSQIENSSQTPPDPPVNGGERRLIAHRSSLIALLLVICLTYLYAKEKPANTPAGVDSTTKLEADSLAKELFGEERIEDKARTEMDWGIKDFNSGEELFAEADSLRRLGVDTAFVKPQGLFGAIRQSLGDTSKSSRENEIRERAAMYFERAAKAFEKALKISPDLKEAQLWLAASYDRMKAWDQSLLIYREILNERQGDDRLWFNFGYAALQGGQYDKAVTGFDQALHISEMVEDDPVKVPNRYRIFAGEAAIRTYQDKRALDFFRAALTHATEAEKAEIERTIAWIEWDGGGIATAEYRDRAYQAEHEERWNDAREAYLAALQHARTQPAYWELTYRLALVEFKFGSRTDALARMKNLMEKCTTISPDYQEGYGKMLFAHAQEMETNGEKREAMSYFLQSTKITWSGQGAGYLEIARIAANDLDTAIEQANKALTYALSDEQKQAAYQILESSYRAKGDWEKMKQYRELMEARR